MEEYEANERHELASSAITHPFRRAGEPHNKQLRIRELDARTKTKYNRRSTRPPLFWSFAKGAVISEKAKQTNTLLQ